MSKRYCRKLIRNYLRYARTVLIGGHDTAEFQLSKLECECDWRP